MDVLKALETRHSIRAYKPDPVAPETIRSIIEAANRSPSWANTQPWEVYVAGGAPLERLRQRFVKNFRNGVAPSFEIPAPKSWPEAHKERTQKMGAERFKVLGIAREDEEARREIMERNFNFFGAPHVIFLCMDKNLTSWSIFDLGSFSMSLMLAAEHYGLNTIPAVSLVAYPDIIREEIGIPEDLTIVFGIALGYGDLDSIHNKYITKRRPVEDFLKLVGV